VEIKENRKTALLGGTILIFKEFCMSNTKNKCAKMRSILATQIRRICVIAIVSVIGFSIAACDDDSGGGGGGGGDDDEIKTSGDLQYTVNGNSITIVAYSGNGGNVTIPAQIGGKPVTAIGERAFISKGGWGRIIWVGFTVNMT
jgi:hypothetical protein